MLPASQSGAVASFLLRPNSESRHVHNDLSYSKLPYTISEQLPINITQKKHATPTDAVHIAKTLDALVNIPFHHGTFVGTRDEVCYCSRPETILII